MRLFAGLRPPDAFRSALSLLQDRLRAAGVTGQYLDPSNLHMTLAFIGEWPEDVTEVLPAVEEMGLKYEFADRNWASLAEKMQQTKAASLIRLLAFALAAVLAVALTVYLFLIRRKREYAVLRALGSPRRAAARALWLPLLALAVLPVLVGMILARLLSDSAGQGEELRSAFGLSALPGLSPLVYLLAAAVVLCLIALACAFYLRALGRRSPLRLLQEKER